MYSVLQLLYQEGRPHRGLVKPVALAGHSPAVVCGGWNTQARRLECPVCSQGMLYGELLTWCVPQRGAFSTKSPWPRVCVVPHSCHPEPVTLGSTSKLLALFLSLWASLEIKSWDIWFWNMESHVLTCSPLTAALPWGQVWDHEMPLQGGRGWPLGKSLGSCFSDLEQSQSPRNSDRCRQKGPPK